MKPQPSKLDNFSLSYLKNLSLDKFNDEKIIFMRTHQPTLFLDINEKKKLFCEETNVNLLEHRMCFHLRFYYYFSFLSHHIIFIIQGDSFFRNV